MTTLAAFCLLCALLPVLLYARNRGLFRPPSPAALQASDNAPLPRVSVLIPARNEEHNIVPCVQSVLASQGVQLEVIVLDDHSSDRTAELVQQLALQDSRVRLIKGQPLPDGWCGKQFACYQLAQHADGDYLAFLDADVHLSPDALARMVRFLHDSQADLVSGFPRQLTGTWMEKLVLPLIHWVLLGFLPLAWMRRKPWPGLGAGCGQWFLTTHTAYWKAGGHAAIRNSRHDGLTLPRAYRRAGLHTDIADVVDLACCRMYHSASQVWRGLAKNATEGMAHPSQIGFWTILLMCGQIVPFVACLYSLTATCLEALLPFVPGENQPQRTSTTGVSSASAVFLPVACWVIAVITTIAVRLDAALRFHHPWWSAWLHPLGVLILLAIQWYALFRHLLGRPVPWKNRQS
ncbi:MAG: glycosyltransferase [Gemmataceae bacterium]|nr:glycosyltransferase [Gemmataceae bacterium]